jgi:hypothetical protein
MNRRVDRVGRGRGGRDLPSTLVRSFVVATHVPRSATDTSVTAHCHAATAVLTREYQGDHRRYVLTPTSTHAVHQHPPFQSLDTILPYQERAAASAAEQRLAPGGGAP